MKFQKRWFVLKGNLLFYFDKKGDKEPLGLLLLEGCESNQENESSESP
jgi:sesquipedalian